MISSGDDLTRGWSHLGTISTGDNLTLGRSECVNRICSAKFLIVFHSNCGSIMLSFRDITTNVGNQHTSWSEPVIIIIARQMFHSKTFLSDISQYNFLRNIFPMFSTGCKFIQSTGFEEYILHYIKYFHQTFYKENFLTNNSQNHISQTQYQTGHQSEKHAFWNTTVCKCDSL